MEGPPDGFEIVTSEGSGAEQSPASSQGTAVGEAGDPTEKPLLPELAGTAQLEESPQNSVLPKNAEKGTQTGKEAVRMFGVNGLKRYLFLQFGL